MNGSDQVDLELVPLQGDPFTIRHAGDLAEFFFRANVSSSGADSYDDWVLQNNDPQRITEGDISAVNRTMGARTPARCWTEFTDAAAEESWLCALDPAWDLFATPERQWSQHGVQTHLAEAFAAVMGSTAVPPPPPRCCTSSARG